VKREQSVVSEAEPPHAGAADAMSLIERRRWAEQEARKLLVDRDELTLASLLDELAELRAGDPVRRSALRARFIFGCAIGVLTAGLSLLAARLL
jgi:hypothetical protein